MKSDGTQIMLRINDTLFKSNSEWDNAKNIWKASSIPTLLDFVKVIYKCVNSRCLGQLKKKEKTQGYNFSGTTFEYLALKKAVVVLEG